jgi:hypothetical protein
MSCKHGTLDVCTVNKVCKYHSMWETVGSVYVVVETQQWMFCYVLKHSISNPTDGHKYRERWLEDIWRWICRSQVYGHDSGRTHYIEKSKKPALP